MNNIYCLCYGCRYSTEHLTGYHKCGTCGLYGHGQAECHSYKLKNKLYESRTKHHKSLPINKHCKVKGCLAKFTHSTGSHQSLFSEDKFPRYTGPDQYGIAKMHNNAKVDTKRAVRNCNKCYAHQYIGMAQEIMAINDGTNIKLVYCGDGYGKCEVPGYQKINIKK